MTRYRIAFNGDVSNVSSIDLRCELRKINFVARGIAARPLKNIEQSKQH